MKTQAAALDQRRGSVERFFGAHAQDYAKSGSHARGADLGTLIDALNPKATDVALDVATGTGFTAISLALRVKRVVGIDTTNEMLEEAKRLAASEKVSNVSFELEDAMNMKLADSFFDIVTTRRATHHFQDVPRFLREARRVLKLGGRLGVVDMSPPQGTQDFSNRIERFRDSSHVEAFTPDAWKLMMTDAGFKIAKLKVLREPVSFERWLFPVELGGEEEESIRAAWTSAPASVVRLLHADMRGGDIKGWTKSRIVIVASKTP